MRNTAACLMKDEVVQMHGKRSLLEIPAGVSRERLIELVECRQLTASQHGDVVAMVWSGANGHEIRHSAFEVASTTIGSETRILRVTPFRVTCWGRLESGWTGTFSLSKDNLRQLEQLDHIRRLHDVPPFGFMPQGRLDTDPEDVERLVLKDQTVQVARDSEWAVLRDGSIIIVEPLNGPRFRYRIIRSEQSGKERIEQVDFSPPLPFEAKSVRALRLLDGYAYVVERAGGETVLWIGGQETKIDGLVDCAWNSPTARAAALLVRPNQTSLERRLVLITPVTFRLNRHGRNHVRAAQRVVYDGSFELKNPKDLWWSPDGSRFVAQVTDFSVSTRTPDRGTRRLVTSDQYVQDLPAGSHVREVVLDETGLLAGYILATKGSHVAFTCAHTQMSVPYAWNLAYQPGGTFTLNTVEGSSVMQHWIYTG